MFSSTIIPTVARPTLARAVTSVLDQDFAHDDFEVIVVNDSGFPLASEDWHSSPRVRILDTNRRERVVARNTGASISTGKYLHFLDDDDWLLPRALQRFWELAQFSSADWLYGVTQLVDREDKPLIRLHHDVSGNCFAQIMAGEWVPLQASMVRAEAFFAIGGFTPLLLATQDLDLCRRIALHGDIAGMEAVVACVEWGRTGSTTDYPNAPVYLGWAREKILDQPGVLWRLRDSARSASWQGRIVRIYLLSALWNVQHRRGLTATSRAVFGLSALMLSGSKGFSPRLWEWIIRHYWSDTFTRGEKEAQALAGQPRSPKVGTFGKR